MHHSNMSLETVRLPVRGMTCGGCVRSVERKLSATPGVSKVQVSLESATATVEYDPAKATVPQLAGAVEQLGYEVPLEQS